jgi:hypothetical protein
VTSPGDRVRRAVSHRRPDVVPYHVTFTEPARARMAEYYGDPDFEAGLGNCLQVIRMRLPYQPLPGRASVWEDEWGVQWDRSIDTDIGTVCNPAGHGGDPFPLPLPGPGGAGPVPSFPRRHRRGGGPVRGCHPRLHPVRTGVDAGRNGRDPDGHGGG